MSESAKNSITGRRI